MVFKRNQPKQISGSGNLNDQTVSSAFESKFGGDEESAGFGARFLSRNPLIRKLQVLLGVLLIVLLIIGILVYRDRQASLDNTNRIVAVSELRMFSQRLGKAASLALQGDPGAFGLLRDAHRGFALNLDHLRNGGELGGRIVPPSPPNAAPRLDDLTAKWAVADQNARQLWDAEKEMVIFGEYLAAFGKGHTVPRVTEQTDPETRRIAAELEAAFDNYRMVGDSALSGLRNLLSATQAGTSLLKDSEDLLMVAGALAGAYRPGSERMIYTGALAVLIALALVVLAIMSKIYLDDARRQGEQLRRQGEQLRRQEEQAEQERRRKEESEKVNDQNQEAILRLMNELGDLADGDLTVTATVSEDITGAIADSINYTVEELRVLVGRINDAANRVTTATEIAQRTSTELLDAAQRQSREIQNAGYSILEVAGSMTRVSADADQSAQVARQSLAAAGKGTQAVQNSIKGMDEIRQQIQETSKRIKRLGESSQEIGEIVELISDITEQTNVLALNAAIQAASAGDAGRGFTVVAEEVQRLAERSGEATKQIAAIVKTIQSDTQGAISAMEESTRGVVEEAKLSDAAGQALAEIGAVSQNLAGLIERISGATRRQADAATGVAGKMQSILKVTEQTTAGTQRTASAVGELAELATELKGSVAGFKVD